jgi:N-acetylmuramoyl-L-alanine amidase
MDTLRPCSRNILLVLSLALLTLLLWNPGQEAGAKASKSATSKAEYAYRQAKAGYDTLGKNARLRTDRRAWMRVITRFRKVYLSYHDDMEVAPKALFMMARCYKDLYGYSKSGRELSEAIERYEVLVEKFPDSRLADDSLLFLGRLYRMTGRPDKAQQALERIIERYAGGDQLKEAERELKAMGVRPNRQASKGESTPMPVTVRAPEKEMGSAGYSPGVGPSIPAGATSAEVLNVRHWSDSDYTRVVIDTSGPVSFNEGSLPSDTAKGLPPRFYLDLSPAVRGKGLQDQIGIRDGLLKDVRVAQFNRKTVRVVFDLGTTQKIKAFYLEEPFRVVVDAFGQDYAKGTTCPIPPIQKRTGQAGGRADSGLSIAQQLGLCVRRVVVDAGHGGKDPGAIGPTGLKEKEVVLRIAKKVAQRLEKELGCEVILTREDDRFLPLEQRAAIANAKKADLFVSIHTNAAPSRRLRGVETYFLNFAVDEDAMRVAATENAMSTKRIADLQKILSDIMKNTKVNESSRLAWQIQNGIVDRLGAKYSHIKTLGVKQAPFFVLIGARMPSILAEVSFISNREEEKRLRDGHYLDQIASGIIDGIRSYARETELAHLGNRVSDIAVP